MHRGWVWLTRMLVQEGQRAIPWQSMEKLFLTILLNTYWHITHVWFWMVSWYYAVCVHVCVSTDWLERVSRRRLLCVISWTIDAALLRYFLAGKDIWTWDCCTVDNLKMMLALIIFLQIPLWLCIQFSSLLSSSQSKVTHCNSCCCTITYLSIELYMNLDWSTGYVFL